jgi:WD40 repeat protein
MKLLRLFICCILCSTYCFAFSQTQVPNATADFIKLDPYGNIYAVKETQLSKFSPQGKLLYSYANHTLGVISSVDVFNSMKIMLFYKDAGKLVFLNEQLALINEPVSLHDANYFTISLASYSASNQIHLYDNTYKCLITLDFNMQEISRTPINFSSFNPTKIIELEEKSLAFQEPESGVYLFDAFGTFNKLIPIITSNPLEVTSELIYYTNNNEVIIYNYKFLTSITHQLSVSNIIQTALYRNNMILLHQDGTLWIYELLK